jgi:serine/threonine-protein kinase RsbW
VIIGGWRGPGWRVVGADPRNGAPIRHWVRSVIAGHGCPVDPDVAEAVVGELFANAVVHGPGGGQVLAGYCLWREGARIVVCDGGGSAAPVLRLADDGVERWRGLRIVDDLAVRWDSFRLPGVQAVWCDLGQPLRVPDADAWAWLRDVLSRCPLSLARPAPGVLAGSFAGRVTVVLVSAP